MYNILNRLKISYHNKNTCSKQISIKKKGNKTILRHIKRFKI